MDPTLLEALAEQNCLLLRQARDLLESLPADHYPEGAPPLFPSSIGSHIRHVLDHYDSILKNSTGVIDYYRRQRDPATENDPKEALRRISAVMESCRGISPVPHLRLRASLSDETITIETTLERELLFSISHTLHHFALIAQICRHFGQAIPEEFGVAPSTLAHRKALSGQR